MVKLPDWLHEALNDLTHACLRNTGRSADVRVRLPDKLRFELLHMVDTRLAPAEPVHVRTAYGTVTLI